ncbi:partial fatty-acyl-CoA synthase, partial [Gammaproteobacteria bacterium]
PDLRHVVLSAPAPALPHLRTLADLGQRADGALPPPSPQPNDALLVLYTSGTTSVPKGVMVRENSLAANAQYLNAWMELRADDRILLLSPFCGIYGVNALIGALLAGATIVVSDTTDAEATIDLAERERITALGGTLDAILRPWTELQLRRPRDLSLLRSRIVPVAWMQGDPLVEMPAAEAALGIRLVHTYGLSEGTAMSLLGDPQETPEHRHSGRLRPVSPHVGIKVAPVADDACPAEPGVGELCLRGPLIMAGYLDDPAATRAAIDDEGWLHTGDFARMYPDGSVRYEGRIKDMVKISGYSVSPAEIEHFLSSHPDIAEVQVVGVPGGKSSDMIAAFVIPKPGAQVDRDSIAAFCEGRIATFKIPTIVRVVSEFPIAPSANADKVQKKFLRDLLTRELDGAPSENPGRKHEISDETRGCGRIRYERRLRPVAAGPG